LVSGHLAHRYITKKYTAQCACGAVNG